MSRTLRFVDLGHGSTISHLRTELAALIKTLGLDDLDLSTVTSQHRRLTQEIARYIYEQKEASGSPLNAGIRYQSRLHDTWECWAIFYDRLVHHGVYTGSIFPDDAGLLEAAEVLGIDPPDPF